MINPADPSKRTGGDGNEKYTPEEKRGPSKFDEALDKAKSDRAKAEVQIELLKNIMQKLKLERPRTYTERLQDMDRLPKGGGGGGGAGDTKFLKPKYKAGGKVLPLPKRADGIAIRGKTKA